MKAEQTGIIIPTWEDIVIACSELGKLGVNSVHINTLRLHMVNSGFDAELCRVGIAEAVGCGLFAFRGGYMALRKDS